MGAPARERVCVCVCVRVVWLLSPGLRRIRPVSTRRRPPARAFKVERRQRPWIVRYRTIGSLGKLRPFKVERSARCQEPTPGSSRHELAVCVYADVLAWCLRLLACDPRRPVSATALVAVPAWQAGLQRLLLSLCILRGPREARTQHTGSVICIGRGPELHADSRAKRTMHIHRSWPGPF